MAVADMHNEQTSTLQQFVGAEVMGALAKSCSQTPHLSSGDKNDPRVKIMCAYLFSSLKAIIGTISIRFSTGVISVESAAFRPLLIVAVTSSFSASPLVEESFRFSGVGL